MNKPKKIIKCKEPLTRWKIFKFKFLFWWNVRMKRNNIIIKW